MAPRIEIICEGVLSDLWSWANTAAAAEELTLGEWMNRLLERERRRLDGGPRFDERTRHVGRRGAAAQMGPGEYTSTELAAMAGTTGAQGGQVGRWRNAGLLQSVRPTRQGVAAAYSQAEVLIAAAFVELEGHGIDDEIRLSIGGAVRDHLGRGGTPANGVLVVAGRAVVVGLSMPVGHLDADIAMIVPLRRLWSRCLERVA